MTMKEHIASLPGGKAAFELIDTGTTRYDSQQNIDSAERAYLTAEAFFHALDARRETRKGSQRRQRSEMSKFAR